MAKAQAHQQFVTICLRDHLIPKGLQLKTQPCVPKSPCRELVVRLEKEWACITRRASRDFLSALKLYHRSCVYYLRLQATNLEASIETRFGKADIRALRLKGEKIYAKWSQRLQERRNKKLKKLHSPVSITDKIKFRRLKRGCRRFKRRTPLPTRMGDEEESPTVINLTNVALDNDKISLLSRGLSFCPTPRQANHEEILDDLESYFRRLCLKEFFLDEDEDTSDSAETQTPFRPPSQWMPLKGKEAAIETYIKKVRMDVERQLKVNKNKQCADNLPSIERNAHQNLRQRTDIVIKPADKGSAVVVLSKEDYIKEADRQLNNQSYY